MCVDSQGSPPEWIWRRISHHPLFPSLYVLLLTISLLLQGRRSSRLLKNSPVPFRLVQAFHASPRIRIWFPLAVVLLKELFACLANASFCWGSCGDHRNVRIPTRFFRNLPGDRAALFRPSPGKSSSRIAPSKILLGDRSLRHLPILPSSPTECGTKGGGGWRWVAWRNGRSTSICA